MQKKYRILDNGQDSGSGRTVPSIRKSVKQQANKKAKKIGKVPTWLVDRAYPKLPKESELSYLKRGLMNSGVGGVANMGKSVGKGLSKIQNKAYKKKK